MSRSRGLSFFLLYQPHDLARRGRSKWTVGIAWAKAKPPARRYSGRSGMFESRSQRESISVATRGESCSGGRFLSLSATKGRGTKRAEERGERRQEDSCDKSVLREDRGEHGGKHPRVVSEGSSRFGVGFRGSGERERR